MQTKHDLKACQELIRHGSHSFFMASLLLPRHIAIPATALYAFCRISDDLIDADNAGDSAIQHLSSRLDAIYTFNPLDFPEDRALAEVVKHFDIPRTIQTGMMYAVLGLICFQISRIERTSVISRLYY